MTVRLIVVVGGYADTTDKMNERQAKDLTSISKE